MDSVVLCVVLGLIPLSLSVTGNTFSISTDRITTLDARKVANAPKSQTDACFQYLSSGWGVVEHSTPQYGVPWDGCANLLKSAAAVTVTIGTAKPDTPPQTHTLIFDTGSSAVAVAGAECIGCLKHSADPNTLPYTYSQSSTHKAVPCSPNCDCSENKCTFGVSYEDKTGGSGYFIEDHFVVSSLPVKNVQFGVITKTVSKAHTLFQSSAGVMGVAYRSLNCQPQTSVYCPLTIMDQLLNQNGLNDSFSLWVGGAFTKGIVTFGGADPAFYEPDPGMFWTPITFAQYYGVTIHSLALKRPDQKTADWPVTAHPDEFGQTIVDSGTTALLLPDPIYDNINATIGKYLNATSAPQISETLWGAINPNSSVFGTWCNPSLPLLTKYFPTLYFYMEGGAVLTVPPEVYWSEEEGCPGDGTVTWCARQFPHLKISACRSWGISKYGGIQTVLGDSVMRAYYINFDRANTRIGFGRAKWPKGQQKHQPIVFHPPPSLPPIPPEPADTGFPLWLLISSLASGLSWILFLLCVCTTYHRQMRVKRQKHVMMVNDSYNTDPLLHSSETL
eukprot:TRINITY_DN16876_c0_g1_i1.p1 TRINITY_DN16876_c0_g1~~TRINITY_DN16876_c0_g1_i1.p1  ORF type:complete len:560 (-),score=35.48 TRINITY_DN16876_c0_g1_i1:181-1860(-)